MLQAMRLSCTQASPTTTQALRLAITVSRINKSLDASRGESAPCDEDEQLLIDEKKAEGKQQLATGECVKVTADAQSV